MLVSDPNSGPSTAIPSTDSFPPPYEGDGPSAHNAPGYSSGSSTLTHPLIPAPNIHPCNHLFLSDKDTFFGGQYVLDVGLPAPPFASSLPVFKQLGNANLRFEVRDGSIEPEIWVAALKEKTPPDTRARIVAKVRDGKTNIILHAPHPSLPRPLISLSLEIRDGRNAIAIPRSFRGQLKLKKRNGAVALSPGVQAVASLLYQADGKHLCCIGERDIDPELADQINLDCRDGGVTIMFDDEASKNWK
ncbi:hypothetical protein K488DRAFT_67132 [Vararia minispora EC-137]|uniref:Uncharacterized protein n=1 Tax=Vararia minispora EC-137 TaxID=1314806 RepID=A0ACB8QZB9_9AGAM|nr:hypothetical protein K488DRAFT_67132 [Vararia minispora EC-137]